MVFCKQMLPLFLMLICLNAGTFSLAQSPVNLEELGVDDGLSQGYVSCLLQDKEGFIWIGTRYGLNRYDGRQFKSFSPGFDANSLPARWVRTISEYKNYLILGFSKQGIKIFDKNTNKAYDLLLKDANRGFPSDYSVLSTYIDKWGNIYAVLNSDHKEWCFVKIFMPEEWPQKQDLDKIEVNFQYIEKPHKSHIYKFSGNYKGDTLWYSNGESLKRMVAKTGETKTFKLHNFQTSQYLKDLKTDPEGAVWLITDSCILRFKNNSWRSMRLKNNEYKNILFSKNGGIILSGSYQMLVSKLPDFKKPFSELENSATKITIPVKSVLDIIEDRSGIVWMGTNGYGLIKYAPQKGRFKQYYPGESVNKPLFFDNNGRPEFVHLKNNIYTPPQSIFSSAIADRFKRIECLIRDPNGGYWAAEYQNDLRIALFKGSPETGWQLAASFPFAGNSTIIAKLDRQGNVLMVVPGKLFRYEPTIQRSSVFDFGNILKGGHRTFDVVQTPDNHMWIATDKGLLHGTPQAEGFKFSLFDVIPGDKNNLLSNEILSLLPDPSNPNLLWIGTGGGGLSCLDMNTRHITNLTSANGLPNDVIYGILADESGNLWLSSNKGLIRYNPASGIIRNYTVEDGLPSNEFNSKAVAKGLDGTMYFGSIMGLIAFHPKFFSDNPVEPKVWITGLEVNNRKINYGDASGLLNKSIEFTQQITLPYSKNNISLELVALEYSAPTKNRFKYYLKGAEAPWAHETTENIATYLNLPPGKYSFFVKACNNDGTWNENPTVLKINILPPWYRTTLAYLVYLLLFSGAIYSIFRFFLHRQRLQHEAERLKELDDFKSKLYTNITHEFRTPLTVIQGMAEEVAHFEPSKPFSKLKTLGASIKRNGENLLQLINQILDLAKLEAKALQLLPINADLVEYVKYMVGSYESPATIKKIRLQFSSTINRLPMMIDKERFQTILSNLLSNALKFAPENGSIAVHVQHSEEWKKLLSKDSFLSLRPMGKHEGDWVSVSVTDNGSGIDSAELPHVFDRFYQADNQYSRSGHGTGIGLALVKELVQLMQGALAVNSQIGEGTTFAVILPIIPGREEVPDTEQLPELESPKPLKNTVLREVPHQSARVGKDLPTLLIIEDNNDVLQYLITCVEDSYQVVTATNGQEGIDLALKTIPDIIISDVMMPVKDGFEVVNTLKNDELTSHIPIIILTAKTDDASRIEGLERGADAYLSKPFNKKELLVRLRKLLELRRKLQERYSSGQVIVADTKDRVIKPVNFEDTFIAKLQQALTENIEEEDFGTPELCRVLGMSRTQLHNKIKAVTGKSTTRYIRSFRLQKAKELLHTTELTITEIAFAVGFKHPQNMTTYFTEEFGKTPSHFRK